MASCLVRLGASSRRPAQRRVVTGAQATGPCHVNHVERIIRWPQPASYVFKYTDDGDGWNELVLMCRGTHVKTILNGVVRTDWDGAGVLDNANHLRRNVGRVGPVALQLHTGDQLRIRVRDIRIREL